MPLLLTVAVSYDAVALPDLLCDAAAVLTAAVALAMPPAAAGTVAVAVVAGVAAAAVTAADVYSAVSASWIVWVAKGAEA